VAVCQWKVNRGRPVTAIVFFYVARGPRDIGEFVMHAYRIIHSKLVLFSIALAVLDCGGCGPSAAENNALKFAKQRLWQLQAHTRNVSKGANGKWYSEKMEIRNGIFGWNENAEATVNYEYRILRSQEFDTEAEARDAELSPVSEAWQTKEEIVTFTDGKWKPKE